VEGHGWSGMVRDGQGWSGMLADGLAWVCWCGRTGKSGVWGKMGEDTHRLGGGANQQKHEKHQFIQKKLYE